MAAKPPDLDSLLHCPICLSECEDPRVLTCLHTLCLKCLEQHINTSARGKNFFCPSCRHKCEVPAGGVTSVPKSFFLNSLKAIIQHQGLREKISVSAQAQHELRRSTPSCDQHSTLPTDMYCDSCRVPVCTKCCLLEHKEHAYREIEGAAEESRSLLSDLTRTAKNITSRLSKNLQELVLSEKKINIDCEEACRQVQENADEIRALVTQREKSVVQEIRQAQTTSLTQLKAAYKEAEINKAAVESLLSYIQALLVSEDATSQVVHAPGLKEQLRQHEVTPLQSVTLDVNLESKIQSLSALSAMLGAVSVPENTKVPLGLPVLKLTPDIENTVSGIATIMDCVCVTAFNKPHLWIYNTKTKTHKRHIFTGLQSAGMTHVGLQSDTIVITDWNNKLHLIKIDQQMGVTEHVVKKLPFQPERVSLDSVNGNLVVVNNTEKRIAICDAQGGVETQVKVKTSVGHLRCALATNDGFVVVDSFQNKLHWLNKVGEVMHTYGKSLSDPLDIIQDSQGHVIVADSRNHQLQLVDVNKNLSYYLLSEKKGILSPTCIYLDEVNGYARLFVGFRDTTHTRRVRVYHWPFVGGHVHMQHKLHVKLPRYQ